MTEPRIDAPSRPPGSAEPAEPTTAPGVAEADQLIAAALADHVHLPAPRRLHDQLARRHLTARRPLRSWLPPFALGAAAAAAVTAVIVHAPAPDGAALAIDEAVGDHLRIVGAPHPLDVESSDIHNVKPWFTGRIDFVPPVSFVGDDEFRLRGGALAVFQGHKAAAFVYQRRLHTISLLVHADAAAHPREETTTRGFHVITWSSGGIGFALVSDIGWDDLRQLEARVRS